MKTKTTILTSQRFSLKRTMLLLTMFLGVVFTWQAEAQTQGCENTSKYPSAAVTPNGDGSSTTISTCNYWSEYSEIGGIISGYEYEFDSVNDGNSAFVTVRIGSRGGPILASGQGPLTVTANSSDNLFVHWNLDANCGTQSSCATSTVSCVTCATALDCEGVPGGPAQPGTPCDDGNPDTVNDVWDADCNCAGIPIATNDEACTATAISCGDEITQSLIGATSSMDDDCNGSGSADVWFTFTSDGSKQYSIGETSSFDAVVQLFEADDCNNLMEVGACQDSPEKFAVTEAGTYYFRVRPYFSSSDEGDITVNLTCVVPSAGDTCDLAIAIDCNAEPVTYSSENSVATNTGVCSMGDNGIWFSFEGTGADITVNSSATFDHEMSFKTGSCGDLTNIICKDSSTGAETYTIEASVANQMYYVYIADYASGSTTTGDITIDIDCAAPVTCPAPTDLAVDNITENSADFSWTTDSNQSDVYLVESSEPAPDENSTPTDTGVTSPVTFDNLTANMAYDAYVRSDCGTDGVSEWAGPETFTTLVTPPDNDDCSGAIALACDQPITGNTLGATASGLSATCGNYTSSSALDLFYSFEADGTSDYTVSVDATPGNYSDFVLFVYSGVCGDLTEIGCADDGNPETMELLAPDAGTYYVRFFRYSGTAEFILNLECSTAVTCPAPTDLAVDNITENSAELSWTTDANQSDVYLVEAGDPAPDENSTPTDTGVTSPITLDNLMTNMAYDAYVRSDCEADGVSDWAGPETFTTLATAPDNDDCSGAIALSCGDSVAGTTVGATASDLGSLSCAGGSLEDVFYTLEVTAGTEYTVTVVGDDYDAVLAIYSGECDNLVEVDCADNGFSAGVEETITYTPDTDGTIVIRTYDWSTSQGNFTISVSCDGEPEPCEDPYNDDAATSDVYISNIEIAGIGIDIGNPDYDFNYTSNAMSATGYDVITNPTVTVYPGLEGAYTVSSGPTGNSNQYYYSVWVDFNQDGCFDAGEQVIWSNDVIWGGGIPNGEIGVTNVPMTWGSMAPGTYQARIRNSMVDHPMAEGNGDGEALDFTVEVITEDDAHRLLGIESQVFNNFTYYPNPVEDQLNLKASTPIELVEVYNLVGQKIVQKQPNALEVNLATDQLQAGVYLMNVTIDGSQKTFRVVRK
ncbi:MAG: fibronectin type III domain-containing protein [Aequorivita sp.]